MRGGRGRRSNYEYKGYGGRRGRGNFTNSERSSSPVQKDRYPYNSGSKASQFQYPYNEGNKTVHNVSSDYQAEDTWQNVDQYNISGDTRQNMPRRVTSENTFRLNRTEFTSDYSNVNSYSSADKIEQQQYAKFPSNQNRKKRNRSRKKYNRHTEDFSSFDTSDTESVCSTGSSRSEQSQFSTMSYQRKISQSSNISNESMSWNCENKVALMANFKNMIEETNPSDLIKQYRQQINEMAEACLEKHGKRLKKIVLDADTANNKQKRVLKEHLNIMKQQQKNFEKYITNIKLKLTDIYGLSPLVGYQKCEEVFDEVKLECKVFKKSLPIYAYKEEILSSVEKNQVTIMSIDACYSGSAVIPLFVYKMNSDSVIVSCEPNDATAVLFAQACRVCEDGDLNNLIGFGAEKDTEGGKAGQTKVIFTSVPKLFCESTSDPLFSDYSCVILHCELKRTIETDFLLDRLRNCLNKRKKFKVILLLSPVDNIPKFYDYFSSAVTVGTVLTPSIVFPVQTMWKKTSFANAIDYIDEVINTALAIHALNDKGDVLVFLPSSSDITKVIKLLSVKFIEYSYNDTMYIPIYEDSLDLPNFSIPESKSNNLTQKRKFFLTTDAAELLSLPSVVYVIDTGIRKELIYDQQKSSDVLTLTFISKAGAKLRKKWAGQYGTGICYRLYNKQDYLKKMDMCEVPQVLCKNPLDTVIRMFQHKPKNALSVNFIESLSEDTKEKSLSMLKNAAAINEGQLTTLGELIVKLPYLPQYSKLIVMGIQWGFSLEVIVLVAYFLVNEPIFVYGEDNKGLQKKVEAIKLQYVSHESDTLTFLNIYRTWVLNDCQESWCRDRAIKFSVLMEVQSKVKDIIFVIKEKLKEDVSLDFKLSQENDWLSLQELLYDCFEDNLCVYTGHYRSGYRLLSTDCITFVHPSSCILEISNPPEFVVFNHLKVTSRHFMIGVTSIPRSLIEKKGSLSKEKYDFLEKKLEPIVIGNVGAALIKHVLLGKKGRKLLEIENEIKKETQCELIIIEPCEEKGTVTLFTSPECAKKAEDMVRDVLKTKLEAVLNEDETLIIELQKGQSKVPVNVTWKKGAVTSEIKVSAEVLGAKPKIKKLEQESEYEGSSVKYSIHLTWLRRMCKGFGFASFTDRDFTVARKLSFKTINVNGKEADVQLNKNITNQLYIAGLPEETTSDDLIESLNVALQNRLSSDAQVESAYVIYCQPFETTDEDIEEIRKHLYNCSCQLLGVNDLTVSVPKPKNDSVIMEAIINVNSPSIIEQGVSTLNNNLQVGDAYVRAKPLYHSTVICSMSVFKALQKKIDLAFHKLNERLQSDPTCYEEKELFEFSVETQNAGFAYLKLSTKSSDIMNILQRRINKLLEGEILTCNNFKKLYKLFTHGGHLWLRTIEEQENVHIIDEYKSKVLRLYGSDENCKAARQRIKEYLANVENEVVTKIDLSNGRHGRTLMKAVIRTYSFDLKGFIEEFKLRSAEINIRASELILHGEPDNIDKAMSALESLASSCSSDVEEELAKVREVCCTCDMPPLQLSLRLEHCGHLYCLECVRGLITSAQFPVLCCAQDCDKELILEDIRKSLDYDETEINRLVQASMTDFIAKNKERFMYCPAPDCSMFFDKTEFSSNGAANTNKWFCRLCQNDICIECNAVYHHGYTCDMYRGSKEDADYSFKVWAKDKKTKCKQCPKCQTAIEKNEGCNHMTCRSCGAHFCWLCVRAFPTGDDVYRHQGSCPNRYV